jgi:hypothetical protein
LAFSILVQLGTTNVKRKLFAMETRKKQPNERNVFVHVEGEILIEIWPSNHPIILVDFGERAQGLSISEETVRDLGVKLRRQLVHVEVNPSVLWWLT